MKVEGKSSMAVKFGDKPSLDIKQLALISHDYQFKTLQSKADSEKRYDFSGVFADVLRDIDSWDCDTALFALFTLIGSEQDVLEKLPKDPTHLKNVLVEVYTNPAQDARYSVFTRTGNAWHLYCFQQKFGSRSYKVDIDQFVREIVPERVMGNVAVLICGEINALKYSPGRKCVEDPNELMSRLSLVKIILNPIHDKMTRFEMKLKQQYLSQGERWLISVWNKGKKDSAGKTKDGKYAWRVFYNGKEQYVEKVENTLGLEIGILDVLRV